MFDNIFAHLLRRRPRAVVTEISPGEALDVPTIQRRGGEPLSPDDERLLERTMRHFTARHPSDPTRDWVWQLTEMKDIIDCVLKRQPYDGGFSMPPLACTLRSLLQAMDEVQRIRPECRTWAQQVTVLHDVLVSKYPDYPIVG